MDFNGTFDRLLDRQVDEYYDEDEAPEDFELFEAFTFGGLRYLLTGTYEGDNLEGGTLYLVTGFGLIEQDWSETDSLTETGYIFGLRHGEAECITDRCYAVADQALEAHEEASSPLPLRGWIKPAAGRLQGAA